MAGAGSMIVTLKTNLENLSTLLEKALSQTKELQVTIEETNNFKLEVRA